MSTRLTMWLCACALLLGSVTTAPAQSGNAGQVNFMGYGSTWFDQYDGSPSSSQEQWLRDNFAGMVVWSPYFDSRTSWFPNAYVYQDLYAIYPGSWVQNNHPEWIAKDQYGNPLYIPFNCSGGTCPQYAGDISNPAYRQWWINNALSMISSGHYPGLFVDDVNMNFDVSDGWGNFVAPIDDTTGQPMNYGAWRYFVALFTQEIQQQLPGINIIHNAIWWGGPSVGSWNQDGSMEAELSYATTINIERGIASDGGLTGGTGVWSIYNLFSYVDYLHSIGKGVSWEEYNVTPQQELYGLAGYFLLSNGQDFIGDMTNVPGNFWNGYSVNLGNPLGPRTYSNGIYMRQFSNGVVALAEPGLGSTTVNLGGSYQDLNGNWVQSVTLYGSSGGVFTGGNATPNAVPQTPTPAPPSGSGVTRYLSDIDGNATYTLNGYGPVEIDLSTGKSPLSINGVGYSKGLGVNAWYEQHWNLYGGCSTFTGLVGVDDDAFYGGNVDFQIWADGRLLFDSGYMHGGQPAKAFNVDLSGYQQLGLVASYGVYQGTQGYDDNGDWVNPVIVCQD